MGTKNQELIVNGMYFESGDDKAVLFGEMSTGVLNYETEITISMTELNLVISHLQLNNDVDVYELISSIYINEIDSLFEADFSCLYSRTIPCHLFDMPESIMEIRA